jgi:thioredoxin-related protein
MVMKKFLLSISLLVIVVFANAQSIEGVSLKNVNTGKNEAAAAIIGSSITVIIFIDNECPYVNSYQARIKKFSAEALASGYNMIFINPHEEKKPNENSLALMKKFMSTSLWKGTLYSDSKQQLVEVLGATKLPEVFIVKSNGSSLKILYKGAFDDNPQNASQVKTQYAVEALKAVEEKSQPQKSQMMAMGCRIKKF